MRLERRLGYETEGHRRPQRTSLVWSGQRKLDLLVNSLKAKKIVMVTTLILFLLINYYFIISFNFFSYKFELQLGGAVEISPRALVVLKPPLVNTIVMKHFQKSGPAKQPAFPSINKHQ